MTSPALLDQAELATRAGVPVERLRVFDDLGLLPAAVRDGDRYGYRPEEATVVRLLGHADRLGIPTDVRVYEGGKADWAPAGLPLVGARTSTPEAA